MNILVLHDLRSVGFGAILKFLLRPIIDRVEACNYNHLHLYMNTDDSVFGFHK